MYFMTIIFLIQHYGTTFPCVSVQDIVTSQFLLLDYLGINEVRAITKLVNNCKRWKISRYVL